MDQLETEGGLQGQLVATLDKRTEDRETLKQELLGATNLLKRVDPIFKGMYKAAADKDFVLSAPDYAVQVAFNSGYRKALKEVYRILYPEVTTNDRS